MSQLQHGEPGLARWERATEVRKIGGRRQGEGEA